MDTTLAGVQLRRYIGAREAAGLQTEPLLPALAITHTLLTAEETTACQDVQRISSAAPHLPGEVRAAGMFGMSGAASWQGSARVARAALLAAQPCGWHLLWGLGLYSSEWIIRKGKLAGGVSVGAASG